MLVIWIFSIVIGTLIGSAKGRLVSGLLWTIPFGPIGVLVVLCLPDLKKQKEDAERKKQRDLQIQLQQAQLQKLNEMPRMMPPPTPQMMMPPPMPPPPPTFESKLRIASDGHDLGELPLTTIKVMLKSGKLTPQDYYLDSKSNQWLELGTYPALA